MAIGTTIKAILDGGDDGEAVSVAATLKRIWEPKERKGKHGPFQCQSTILEDSTGEILWSRAVDAKRPQLDTGLQDSVVAVKNASVNIYDGKTSLWGGEPELTAPPPAKEAAPKGKGPPKKATQKVKTDTIFVSLGAEKLARKMLRLDQDAALEGGTAQAVMAFVNTQIIQAARDNGISQARIISEGQAKWADMLKEAQPEGTLDDYAPISDNACADLQAALKLRGKTQEDLFNYFQAHFSEDALAEYFVELEPGKQQLTRLGAIQASEWLDILQKKEVEEA